MNYRHIYHAGNFADIFKHLILTMTVDHLRNKEKGFFILDAFAGCGLYDLKSAQARKTDEYRSGVGAFMDMVFTDTDLIAFQSILRPYWQQELYPGSPLLIADKLRPQDRLLANELHPEDHYSLCRVLEEFPGANTAQTDAYEIIRALLPPAERRGLVLVDPPFERKDEFEVLSRQMESWIDKWATGCYMIWYPLKAKSNSRLLVDSAMALDANRIWISEFLLQPRETPDSFNGCGVLIINSPFQVPERVEKLSASLCSALGGLEIVSHYLRN